VIVEVAGDILLSNAQAIAHGVAPNDDFRQGLALALRQRAPAMYGDFRHFCKTKHPEPGSLWTWMGADGRLIINLFTQDPPRSPGDHPGRASLRNVEHCLRTLRALVGTEQLSSLALPRLATGVGGLDWQLVQPLIRQHLGDLEIPVIVYATYHSGQAAPESLSVRQPGG
jgi:O-acetyl-ADP-ribose deacetylase (regulator of RNase III)